ncbi:hypothetical protein [Corallococcus interemptor]|uniref:hypothetical protein n=1 Tax=Corallococcus interemptor TaxID=2316720 RepID=UPI0011C42EEF|nr:hypothetical protein [Corallococcus interemptor]
MANYSDLAITISKTTDKKILETIQSIFKNNEINIHSIHLTMEFGGNQIQLSKLDDPYPPEIREILSLDSYSIINFTIQTTTTLSLLITRQLNTPTDSLHVRFGNPHSHIADPSRTQVIKTIKQIRENLQSPEYLTTKGLRSILAPELNKYYELRETGIARIEATLDRVSTQLTEDARHVRHRLEEEFRQHTKELEEAHAQRTKQLNEELSQREQEIERKRQELEARTKEIDNSKSTHARRKLRQDLKEELSKRNERFQLTSGTQRLRWPIFIFTLFLLLSFFIGLTTYSYVGFVQLTTKDGLSTHEIIATIIKHVTFAIAFASTSVFFIRWNNRWFQAHADEEFRQKRFDLDLDRASWVVEMALEWKEEKGTEIPSELLSRLTNGLFVEEAKTNEEPLHPADQLASAIFGASSGASIEVPGGTKVQLDRKGIQHLKKKH